MNMTPERARQLRDQERGLQRPHSLAPQAGARKHREIRLFKLKLWQVEEARALLSTLPALEVGPGTMSNGISVWYDIADHSMEALETLLTDKGFHLENTLYCKLVRALVVLHRGDAAPQPRPAGAADQEISRCLFEGVGASSARRPRRNAPRVARVQIR